MPLQPRISVIIPSLNHEHFIERALCSVLDQGYENLELIVIDGGSDDRTAEILETHRNRLAYCHSAMNAGPADAINQGLTHATGDIVGILHADDLYLPGALDAAADAMVRKGKAEWIVAHVLRIDEDDHHLGQQLSSAPSAHHWSEYLTQEEGVLPLSASFYRRSLFDRFGGFDAALQYAYDFDFHAKLLWKGRQPQVVELVLAAQREHVRGRTLTTVAARGMEFVDVALHHGEKLSIGERFTLWQACDEKRRIYTIASAEMRQDNAKSYLWEKLLRRPWWLASAHYRATLLRGAVDQVEVPQRKAA